MDFFVKVVAILLALIVCVPLFRCSSAQRSNQGLSFGGQWHSSEDTEYYIHQSSTHPKDCSNILDKCSLSVSSGVYLIKPDGYPDPFEVFCANDTDGGWTVIQRRYDGSLDYNRTWEDYKHGFGFPSSEFWIGNERLSFLTNQNYYELRVDLLLSDGSPFHLKYDSFRISDEWGNYTLIYNTLGNITRNEGFAFAECPQNMSYYGCTCEATCEDILGEEACQTNCEQNTTCVCQHGFARKGDNCVNISECGCFISEENRYISSGDIYVNADCTRNCTCDGNRLSCEDYGCSSSATCGVGQNGIRQCSCNDGYSGDGVTCTPDAFKDCTEALSFNHTQDGVYTVLPTDWSGPVFSVFCKMSIDGGGWTVFQRRSSGATGFYESWENYKNGFGDIQDEFWLGNEKIHYLTKQGTYELRVDFVTSSNSAKFSKYTRFTVDSVTNNYRVTDIGTYSGNGGNGMSDVNGRQFSTHDSDHDGLNHDCAEKHQGGWWYGGSESDYCHYYLPETAPCHEWYVSSNYHNYRLCRSTGYCQVHWCKRCSTSNLNGGYNGGDGQNIFWDLNNNCNIKYTEMKIRRIS